MMMVGILELRTTHQPRIDLICQQGPPNLCAFPDKSHNPLRKTDRAEPYIRSSWRLNTTEGFSCARD